MELLDLIRDHVPEGCSFLDFVEKISVSESFVAAYKSRFFTNEVIVDATVIELVKEVCSLDFSKEKPLCRGLDGFSLNCRIAAQQNELHLWCCFYEEYYLSVGRLANWLLDVAEAPNDSHCRFHLIKRPR